ncbi:MAG TPA: antitoxin family protein [bacterium]
MSQTITAIFENGVFRPIEKVDNIRTRFVKIEIKPADEDEPSIQEWLKNITSRFSNKKITPDTIFADDLTVKEYVKLSEAEKEKLWDNWYQESRKGRKEIIAKELQIE